MKKLTCLFKTRSWLVSKDKPLALFCLIDNAIKSANTSAAQGYLGQLFRAFPLRDIQVFMNGFCMTITCLRFLFRLFPQLFGRIV